MDLPQLLKQSRTAVIADALSGLSRATLPHYTASKAERNRERLEKLFDLTQECVETRTVIPIVEYARSVARERYDDGFGFQEVHTAFNVLEEVIWRTITAELQPPQYPEAFGLASTVLGAGKQALALEWVSLAGHNKAVKSLDLSALFKGTA
jgi:hypothetical protein